MAVDHDRARELQDTSLRALMDDPPDTDWWNGDDRSDLADWIDAVLAAWERGER